MSRKKNLLKEKTNVPDPRSEDPMAGDRSPCPVLKQKEKNKERQENQPEFAVKGESETEP